MRFIAPLILCGGIALAVAGCSNADKHYFKEGVGANLYAEGAIPITEDATSRTELQRQYVEAICKQAGLFTAECGPGSTNPQVWSTFVQAGMNDIDQRCDAYLTWLDNVRRAQPHTLKELADAQTATTIIMERSGINAAPIAIAAAAFGFAIDTFTNVTARLVLEVDRSTVQTLVLSRQKKYREDLFGTASSPTKVVIANRPAAIFALRSYLRLCMPMTIETEINTLIATFERGGADALKKDGMISAGTVGVSTIIDVNKPTPKGPKPSAPPPDRKGPIEGPLPKKAIIGYQDALCVVPADGKLGPTTRAAISEYLKMHKEPDTSAQFDYRTPGLLQEAVDSIGSCRGKFLMNVYEAENYGKGTKVAREKKIGSLQETLANALKARGSNTILKISGEFTDDSKFGDPTRDAIAELRKLLDPKNPAVQDVKSPKNRQLDVTFEDEINP